MSLIHHIIIHPSVYPSIHSSIHTSIYLSTAALDLSLSSKRIRLNSDKTYFIWFGDRDQLSKIYTELLRDRFHNFITLPHFANWALQRIQCSNSQTMSIVSIQHAFIVCAYYASSVARSPLTLSTLLSMHHLFILYLYNHSVCGDQFEDYSKRI